MASPSELFSCVDAKMVLTSPINNSTSKTHWSFARDSRFKKPQVLYIIIIYAVATPFISFQEYKTTRIERLASDMGKRQILMLVSTLITKHPHLTNMRLNLL